jgi:hypothetical protein
MELFVIHMSIIVAFLQDFGKTLTSPMQDIPAAGLRWGWVRCRRAAHSARFRVYSLRGLYARIRAA